MRWILLIIVPVLFLVGSSLCDDNNKKADSSEYYQLVNEVLGGIKHYEILQISEDADKQQIKKSFHKLSGQHHPDKVKVKTKETEEKYLSIMRAYQVLSSENLREIYDDFLKNGVPLEKRYYGRWAHYYGAPEHDIRTVLFWTIIVVTGIHFELKRQRYNRLINVAKKTNYYKQQQKKLAQTENSEGLPEIEVGFTGLEKPSWKQLLPVALVIWISKTTYNCSWYVLNILILRKTYDPEEAIMKKYNLTREEYEEQKEKHRQKMEKLYHSAKGKRMRRFMKKYQPH